MKFTLRLHRGNAPTDHQVELRLPPGVAPEPGRLTFSLDQEAGEADWAEVAAGVYSILIAGRSYEARVMDQPGDAAPRGRRYLVAVGTRNYLVETQDLRSWGRQARAVEAEGPQEIRAPMPGKIVKVLVRENQEVNQGAGLLVIEAMKMQNELRAPRPGRVEKIYAVEGTGVESGAPLLRLL